jgi:acyl carrier protein
VSGDEVRRAEVERRVRRAVADVLWADADELDVAKPLVDYGMDSLRAVQLVSQLESEFMLPLVEDVIVRWNTASDIVDHLMEGVS